MSHPSFIVFGGNSRLAAALRRHLPAGTRHVARAAPAAGLPAGGVAVGDYAATPAALLAGAGVAINCAGIARGTPDALDAANVATPLHLARLARDAGVARFVHVSSFSILGRADRIDAGTPARPASAYGRSKLAAEAALLALATPDFAVTMVRLPAIIGGGGADKLASLIRLWLKLRRLPVPAMPVSRSMIGFDLAARVLADIARDPVAASGVVHAADPAPFTYAQAAAAIAAATGRRIGTIAVPAPLLALLGRVAPGAHDSLWTDSLLDPAANHARAMPSDLYATIAAIARAAAAR